MLILLVWPQFIGHANSHINHFAKVRGLFGKMKTKFPNCHMSMNEVFDAAKVGQ